MNYKSILRWPIGLYYPVAIFSAYILAIMELMVRRSLYQEGMGVSTHPYFTYILVAMFFILMGIIQWFRYRLWQYPVLGLIVGALCLTQAANFYDDPQPLFIAIYAILFIILVLFVILNWKVLYGQERFEINSRRLFRLAAGMIRETGNGFTERPYSAGKIDFTRDEIQGLSRFLNGRYITKSFYLEDRIILAFSMNKSLMLLDNPAEVSHVTIHYGGNIEVKISEKDYREFTSKFSFDRLCGSIAMIFGRFLENYRLGLEQRIISELKAAR